MGSERTKAIYEGLFSACQATLAHGSPPRLKLEEDYGGGRYVSVI